MRVNTHARRNTLKQIEKRPYYFSAKRFIKRFDEVLTLPRHVREAIRTGRFVLASYKHAK
jgi:hypothetical protein